MQKTLRNASLQGLYYGAMEALGNFSDVQKMERRKRIVPIFDLTSFNYLMEWSESIDQFIKSGNSTGVSRLAAKSARTILSQTKGRERSQHTIRTFANNLEAFTKTLSTCRGRDISANVIRLKQNLEACQEIKLNSSLNKPLQPLFEKISKQLDEFPENNIKGGVQAAQWCLDNNLIQQGYTILQETLISYFASGIDQNAESYETNRVLRELAGQTVYIFLKQQPEKNWPNKSKENKKIVDNYLTFFKTINMDLLKIFRDLSDFRNDINHCGHNKHPRPAMKFESSLGEFIEKTKLVL